MKRTRLLAALLATLVAALPAAAAQKAVTVTKNGFVPNDVSIAPGDSILWKNSDTVVHQVAFDKVACNVVLQPGQEAACAFPQAGTYQYRDPSQRGSFRGTVRVQAASASLSLTAARQVVVFGSQVNLSGVLASQAAGETITVLAQPHGATAFTPVRTTTTLAGGAYAYPVKPAIETSYQARAASGASGVVKVEVRPRVVLAVIDAKKGIFTARVAERRAPVGRTVDFQRRNAYGQWVTLKRVTLKTSVSQTVAGARFTAKLPAGASTVRLFMPKAQAGAGYLQGTSPARTVRR